VAEKPVQKKRSKSALSCSFFAQNMRTFVEYFQTFSNGLFLPNLPKLCNLTRQPPFLPPKS
jgi:hypothetical protein